MLGGGKEGGEEGGGREGGGGEEGRGRGRRGEREGREGREGRTGGRRGKQKRTAHVREGQADHSSLVCAHMYMQSLKSACLLTRTCSPLSQGS